MSGFWGPDGSFSAIDLAPMMSAKEYGTDDTTRGGNEMTEFTRFWERNIDLRMTMLKHGVADFRAEQVHKRAAWSIQMFHVVRHGKKLTTSSMARMGNALGIPVSVLLSSDPSEVVAYPVEPFLDGTPPRLLGRL